MRDVDAVGDGSVVIRNSFVCPWCVKGYALAVTVTCLGVHQLLAIAMLATESYLLARSPLSCENDCPGNNLLIADILLTAYSLAVFTLYAIAAASLMQRKEGVLGFCYFFIHIVKVSFGVCTGAIVYNQEQRPLTMAIFVVEIFIAVGNCGVLIFLVVLAGMACVSQRDVVPTTFTFKTTRTIKAICAFCKGNEAVRVSGALAFHHVCLDKFIHNSDLSRTLGFFGVGSMTDNKSWSLVKCEGVATLDYDCGLPVPIFTSQGSTYFVNPKAEWEVVKATSDALIKAALTKNDVPILHGCTCNGWCM